MFRLASVFALACLTLAATAFLTTPKSTAAQPPCPDNDPGQGITNRCAALPLASTAYFHARFSLN